MKILGLILVTGLLASGCANFKHSEVVDTDQQGYATGRYASHSEGRTGSVMFGASGAGSAAGISNYGFGFGALALSVETGPPPVTPYYFAKSIAMINYSRNLKSIKYDQLGGIVEYQFYQRPSGGERNSPNPQINQSKLPASFGHKPIE
jgi:hypothetical protein